MAGHHPLWLLNRTASIGYCGGFRPNDGAADFLGTSLCWRKVHRYSMYRLLGNENLGACPLENVDVEETVLEPSKRELAGVGYSGLAAVGYTMVAQEVPSLPVRVCNGFEGDVDRLEY